MIKFKQFNVNLCKKITAFSLATTMSFGSIPIKKVHATDDMCYEVETIAEYKTMDGDYTVKKYYDNSFEINEVNSNYHNKLTLSSDGTVNISTQNKKYLGLFTDTKEETFKITKFDTQKLDVDKSNVDSNIIKRVLELLNSYLNSNTLNNENFIELFGEDLMDTDLLYGYNGDDIKNISSAQYNDTYLNYMNDLNNNGLKIKKSSGEALVLGTALVGTLSGESLAGLADLICPEAILVELLIAGLYLGEVYINDAGVLSLDDINENYEIDEANLADRSTWLTLTDAMDIVENNYNDDNPNNDYYRAVISKNENNVYINFANPMSIDEAANLIKQYDPYLPLNNVYTYQPEDAINVISHAGGIAGTSRSGVEYINHAECHAFEQSYRAFDTNTLTYDLNELRLKQNARPGIYYWHYHFNEKRIGESKDLNGNHIFFGIPIIITQNDIDKYINGSASGSVSDLDNFDYINNNYVKSRDLKR